MDFIIRVHLPTRMARMGERRSAYWVWRVNLKARVHLEDLGKEGTQYKNVSSRNRTEVEGVDSINLA